MESNIPTPCTWVEKPAWVSSQGAQYVEENNSYQLIASLQLGPISAAIDANSTDFMLYSSGVITDASACGTTPNHAVLVTGYNNGDTNSGLPFYHIKNSFGTTWGQDGYAMIGVQNGVGICAIQSEPVIANMLLSSNNL